MTIKEISERYAITPDTLRYYEKVGIIRPVTRKNGIRQYGEKEITNIEFIACMRNAGLPVKVLIEYLELFDRGVETRDLRVQILRDQREIIKQKIADLNKAVKILDYKIDIFYQDTDNKL